MNLSRVLFLIIGISIKKKEIASQLQKKKAKRHKHFRELTCCHLFYALFHNASYLNNPQGSKVHQKCVHFLSYSGRIIIDFCEGTMCLRNFNRYILK